MFYRILSSTEKYSLKFFYIKTFSSTGAKVIPVSFEDLWEQRQEESPRPALSG